MMSQPCVMPVQLLLNHVVPLPQSSHQSLVVGGEELDMLPILANFLFKVIGLNAPLLAKLNCSSFKGTYPCLFIHHHHPQPHQYR